MRKKVEKTKKTLNLEKECEKKNLKFKYLLNVNARLLYCIKTQLQFCRHKHFKSIYNKKNYYNNTYT